jgi:hypothetical protein
MTSAEVRAVLARAKASSWSPSGSIVAALVVALERTLARAEAAEGARVVHASEIEVFRREHAEAMALVGVRHEERRRLLVEAEVTIENLRGTVRYLERQRFAPVAAAARRAAARLGGIGKATLEALTNEVGGAG